MWFLRKNINLSSMFKTYILEFHFTLIIILNFITTIPTPAAGSAIPPPDSGNFLSDITTQEGNYFQETPKSPQKPPTENIVQQLAPLSDDQFPLSSIPLASPLMNLTQNENEKTKTTDEDEDEDENPFSKMDTAGLFDDYLPTKDTLESEQINGIADSTDDQGLSEKSNTINYDWADYEGNDPYQAYLQDLMKDNEDNNIKNNELSGENQLDQNPSKLTDEDLYNENPDLMENAKFLEKLSQSSASKQNPLEEGNMVDNSDDELKPSSLSDQDTQLSADEETDTDNEDLETNSETLNQMLQNSDKENNLPQDETNNINNESIGFLSPEPDQINKNTSIMNNIKKKRKKVPFKLEYKGEARVFCTFGNQIQKMYKKVKKYFIDGDLCHAIVYGVPLTIQERSISMSKDDQQELESVYRFKGITMLVVIMQHSSYEAWSQALNTPKKYVNIIMNFLRKYHVDGIQFTNLEPSPGDQVDTDMVCKLIIFFEMLTKATEAIRREFKIGMSISPYAQTESTGFHSFEVLNDLVSWYSLHTVSMVQCTPAYMKGTSPLDGTISLTTSFLELMKTDIRKDKVIISIQLYANKFGTLKPQSYIEMCLLEPGSWNKWCAARPEDFRLKGEFLRDLEIWGVQLYYMESDDYKALCDCYKFPMIRALLRGMSKREPPKGECDYLGEVENQQSKCSYENLLPSIDARLERQYKLAQKEAKQDV